MKTIAIANLKGGFKTDNTAGILISILAGTPVGSTIVAVDIAVFLISYGIGRITGR